MPLYVIPGMSRIHGGETFNDLVVSVLGWETGPILGRCGDGSQTRNGDSEPPCHGKSCPDTEPSVDGWRQSRRRRWLDCRGRLSEGAGEGGLQEVDGPEVS